MPSENYNNISGQNYKCNLLVVYSKLHKNCTCVTCTSLSFENNVLTRKSPRLGHFKLVIIRYRSWNMTALIFDTYFFPAVCEPNFLKIKVSTTLSVHGRQQGVGVKSRRSPPPPSLKKIVFANEPFLLLFCMLGLFATFFSLWWALFTVWRRFCYLFLYVSMWGPFCYLFCLHEWPFLSLPHYENFCWRPCVCYFVS